MTAASKLLESSKPITDISSIMINTKGPSLKCDYIVSVIPPSPFFQGVALPFTYVAFKQVSLLARDAEFPGKTISTTPHRMYGTVREMPYGALYDTIDITFMCTNSMIERAFFNLWQDLIVSPKSCYLNYYNDYVGTISIIKLDNTNDPITGATSLATSCIIEEAYPKVVKAQDLSYTAKNEISTVTVTFSYARWRMAVEKVVTMFGKGDGSGVTSIAGGATSLF